MRLSLLRAKEAFATKAPIVELDYRLNRVCERLLLHGKFMGSLKRLALAAPFGQVALPPGYRTMEAAQVNGRVLDIANRWWAWIPGHKNILGDSLETIDDLDDGWAVMYTPQILPLLPGEISPNADLPVYDFPQGIGTIAVVSGDTPFPIVTITGKDTTERTIKLVISNATPVTNPFSRIVRIHKERTISGLTVSYTAADARVISLAIMEPNEEESYYRRYFIPVLRSQPDVAIASYCKQRHIEFTSDDDVLPFSNLSALELGLDAYNYDRENDKTLANQYWDDAVKILNKELEDTNSPDQIPSVRFHYPGGTAPRLTSHY